MIPTKKESPLDLSSIPEGVSLEQFKENYKLSTLPKEFIGKGEVKSLKFQQAIANPQAFVYEVTSDRSKYFEVFMAKWDDRFQKYKYPSSKSFGKWAWWYPTLDKAMIKFNELIKL